MSSPAEPQVLETLNDGVLTVTLNRPARRNALSESMLLELGQILERTAIRSDVRCVILAANGPVFSSGHDLNEMGGRAEEEYAALFSRCSTVMQQLRRLPQPVIARVHALATAAGCQLVAACDLVIAATDARFATPGVRIGLFCTTPMVPLVRSMPPKIAMEMLLTGQPITAQRAYEVGFVNRVVASEDLDTAIRQWTDAICASSAHVLELGKRAFYEQLSWPESQAYEQATQIMTQNAICGDAQEGISAFLQKRAPVWAHSGVRATAE